MKWNNGWINQQPQWNRHEDEKATTPNNISKNSTEGRSETLNSISSHPNDRSNEFSRIDSSFLGSFGFYIHNLHPSQSCLFLLHDTRTRRRYHHHHHHHPPSVSGHRQSSASHTFFSESSCCKNDCAKSALQISIIQISQTFPSTVNRTLESSKNRLLG